VSFRVLVSHSVVSKAVTYVYDRAKYISVADNCVSTSGGQTVLCIKHILTLVMNTYVLYTLDRHVSKYILQSYDYWTVHLLDS